MNTGTANIHDPRAFQTSPDSDSEDAGLEDLRPEDGHDENSDGADVVTTGKATKRQRITQACDQCRRRKIKCNGEMPKCNRCQEKNSDCIYVQINRTRHKPGPKGAKHYAKLEERLEQMETALRANGLLEQLGFLHDGVHDPVEDTEQQSKDEAGVGESTHGESQRHETQRSKQTNVSALSEDFKDRNASSYAGVDAHPTPSSSTGQVLSGKKNTPDVRDLADRMDSLFINKNGETRYIGGSSGFSIASPRGIQWVEGKTRDTSFKKTLVRVTHEESAWDNWQPEVFEDLFHAQSFEPLPGKSECIVLVEAFFDDINHRLPLFHKPTFMLLLDRQYSSQPWRGSGWWASLNTVLAFALRRRADESLSRSGTSDTTTESRAWGYLKNAMAVVTELTIRNTDLLSVQALLVISLFLFGTSNDSVSYKLTGAAIRLAHSIGLHRPGFQSSEPEEEQRKRVFWVACILDRELVLRFGRPPLQDDDDTDVELPSEFPYDSAGIIDLNGNDNGSCRSYSFNLFRHNCIFAQIQGRVHKRLYTAKASRQSDTELQKAITDLDAELRNWRNSIPLPLRPGQEIDTKYASEPFFMDVLIRNFAHNHLLATVHKVSAHSESWASRRSTNVAGKVRPRDQRALQSAEICVNAARTNIKLLKYFPRVNCEFVWLILYYPVSALATLFTNVLQNPGDSNTSSDLELMASVISFLSVLAEGKVRTDKNLYHMLPLCREMERIAYKMWSNYSRAHAGTGPNARSLSPHNKTQPPTVAENEKSAGKRREQRDELNSSISSPDDSEEAISSSTTSSSNLRLDNLEDLLTRNLDSNPTTDVFMQPFERGIMEHIPAIMSEYWPSSLDDNNLFNDLMYSMHQG